MTEGGASEAAGPRLSTEERAISSAPPPGPFKIFLIFLSLGLTSFGGPTAHIGFFREEFVARRKWLSDAAYADLVALCQFMPGPASSQVGLAIGLGQGGLAGAAAAWLGFTLPSALAMAVFGLALAAGDGAATTLGSGALLGLIAVAAAVVLQALTGMARSLLPTPLHGVLALVAAAAALTFTGVAGQIGAILLGAVAGLVFFGASGAPGATSAAEKAAEGFGPRSQISPVLGGAALALFAALLLAGPALAALSTTIAFMDAFFRTGALVFGGGHVVLPLLEAETVARGWVAEDDFVAGYGAAQAMPGPLFTFASFLGAAATTGADPAAGPSGAVGALLATIAIFAPSFLLVIGLAPFWARLRSAPVARAVLGGVNAAVVGVLGAAFFDPVLTAAVQIPLGAILALIAWAALTQIKAPPWAVVAAGGLAGFGLELAGLLDAGPLAAWPAFL